MADPDARAAWVHANVDADLQFIFQESGMGEQVVYDIGQHYRTVRRFSSIADDRAGLRPALQDDFQLRPDTAANRSALAAIVWAWEAARFSHEEEVKLRQEEKSLGASSEIEAGSKCLADGGGQDEKQGLLEGP